MPASTDSSKLSSEVLTKGQIRRLQARLGVALRKARFRRQAFQQVLERHVNPMVAEIVRSYVDAASHLTVRRVKDIDRSLSPEEMLNRLPHLQIHVYPHIVATMPRRSGDRAQVVYFEIDEEASMDQLELLYELYDLVPDPYAHAWDVQYDSAFVDRNKTATIWKNAAGEWCSMSFGNFGNERQVSVHEYTDPGRWHNGWKFAGVRKRRTSNL